MVTTSVTYSTISLASYLTLPKEFQKNGVSYKNLYRK